MAGSGTLKGFQLWWIAAATLGLTGILPTGGAHYSEGQWGIYIEDPLNSKPIILVYEDTLIQAYEAHIKRLNTELHTEGEEDEHVGVHSFVDNLEPAGSSPPGVYVCLYSAPDVVIECQSWCGSVQILQPFYLAKAWVYTADPDGHAWNGGALTFCVSAAEKGKIVMQGIHAG